MKEWIVPRRKACGNNHTSFNRVHFFLRGIDGDEMHASSIVNANRTGNKLRHTCSTAYLMLSRDPDKSDSVEARGAILASSVDIDVVVI